MPAIYVTKAEAEQAASKFNCTGTYPMGNRWMPCTNHGDATTHHH